MGMRSISLSSEVVEGKAGDGNGAFALRDFPSTQSVGCSSCILGICIRGEWMKESTPVRKGTRSHFVGLPSVEAPRGKRRDRVALCLPRIRDDEVRSTSSVSPLGLSTSSSGHDCRLVLLNQG